MAPDPQCAAIAAAKAKKGWSYAQLATAAESNEDRIVAICSGLAKPTKEEFAALAKALDITDNVTHTGVHATA